MKKEYLETSLRAKGITDVRSSVVRWLKLQYTLKIDPILIVLYFQYKLPFSALIMWY